MESIIISSLEMLGFTTTLIGRLGEGCMQTSTSTIINLIHDVRFHTTLEMR